MGAGVSAWGSSFGLAFGDSWGEVDFAPQLEQPWYLAVNVGNNYLDVSTGENEIDSSTGNNYLDIGEI